MVENWFTRSGSHTGSRQNLIDKSDIATRATYVADFNCTVVSTVTTTTVDAHSNSHDDHNETHDEGHGNGTSAAVTAVRMPSTLVMVGVALVAIGAAWV